MAGGSVGGMQVLQWAVSYPEKICSAILIATTMKPHLNKLHLMKSLDNLLWLADVNWNNGNYYNQSQPDRGLAIARMIGHITYMSDKSMQEKFSRNLKDKDHSFETSFTHFLEKVLKEAIHGYCIEKYLTRIQKNCIYY